MVGAIEVDEGGYHGRTGWAVQEAARERGIWLRLLGNVRLPVVLGTSASS